MKAMCAFGSLYEMFVQHKIVMFDCQDISKARKGMLRGKCNSSMVNQCCCCWIKYDVEGALGKSIATGLLGARCREHIL
jgi:hypothetical protein